MLVVSRGAGPLFFAARRYHDRDFDIHDRITLACRYAFIADIHALLAAHEFVPHQQIAQEISPHLERNSLSCQPANAEIAVNHRARCLINDLRICGFKVIDKLSLSMTLKPQMLSLIHI